MIFAPWCVETWSNHCFIRCIFMLWAIICWVHFFTVRWTVQSIYAIIRFSFFMIFCFVCNISASLVTCCMSNTADLLCQYIVHVWHCLFFFFLWVIFMALSNESILKVLCTVLGGYTENMSHDSGMTFIFYVWMLRTDLRTDEIHTDCPCLVVLW